MKAIAGEDGVAVCRSLLDGIEDDGEGELQSRVTEGRCTGMYSTLYHVMICYKRMCYDVS